MHTVELSKKSKNPQSKRGVKRESRVHRCQVCGFYRNIDLFGSARNYYEGNTSPNTCNPCYEQLLVGLVPPTSISKQTQTIAEQKVQILALQQELAQSALTIQKISLTPYTEYSNYVTNETTIKLEIANQTVEHLRAEVASLKNGSVIKAMQDKIAQIQGRYDKLEHEYAILHDDYLHAVEYSTRFDNMHGNPCDDLCNKYLV